MSQSSWITACSKPRTFSAAPCPPGDLLHLNQRTSGASVTLQIEKPSIARATEPSPAFLALQEAGFPLLMHSHCHLPSLPARLWSQAQHLHTSGPEHLVPGLPVTSLSFAPVPRLRCCSPTVHLCPQPGAQTGGTGLQCDITEF